MASVALTIKRAAAESNLGVPTIERLASLGFHGLLPDNAPAVFDLAFCDREGARRDEGECPAMVTDPSRRIRQI